MLPKPALRANPITPQEARQTLRAWHGLRAQVPSALQAALRRPAPILVLQEVTRLLEAGHNVRVHAMLFGHI